jgi:hypothetical protein
VRSSRDAEYTDYVQARLPWLRRVAYLLCQDWQSADDLVQAAITRLYTHWGRARNAASVSIDMNTPGSNAPLPGSSELGGALGVLARLRFLGADPAAWTAAPLG